MLAVKLPQTGASGVPMNPTYRVFNLFFLTFLYHLKHVVQSCLHSRYLINSEFIDLSTWISFTVPKLFCFIRSQLLIFAFVPLA